VWFHSVGKQVHRVRHVLGVHGWAERLEPYTGTREGADPKECYP
jgi:hypothetical protein